MKFYGWFASMGITAVIVFCGMLYLNTFFCLPMENHQCISASNMALRVNSTKVVDIVNSTNSIPVDTNLIPVGKGLTAAPNGKKIDFALKFVMSPNFSQYAFNELPGKAGTNPDIKVKSGDTIIIHIKNNSKSFHAFGVVINISNPSHILWDSAIATPDAPLRPGQTGDVTFVAGSPGLYHYICTIPGHANLGMSGNFIVE